MVSQPRYLVIDDDPDVLKAAAFSLAPAANVEVAASPAQIEAQLAGGGFDAVLLDMNFVIGARDGREGFDALDRAARADPSVAIILMTTYGGVSLAVEALKRGAADFVLKPWRNDALARVMAEGAQRTAERRRDRALSLDQIERRAMVQALERFDGNVTHAAKALGLTRPAFYRRMARHGL
ncbi:MAG: sigma-54-dependent Fis family transcriptional regulator [Caulobacteraceae bacterium]|nr:sigma-54-dependent Fis family transcriptional regulator [Caulobacteraceae bacterium]